MRFLIFFLLTSCALKKHQYNTKNVDEQCVPSSNECKFYTCLEKKKDCGDSGYVLGYVKPYCEKFQNECNINHNDSRVKTWLESTRLCLQQKMLPVLNNPERYSCEEVHNLGFESHSYCYTEGAEALGGRSFCDIGPLNIASISLCIESSDLFSFDGINQVSQVLKQCLLRFPFSGLFLYEDKEKNLEALMQSPIPDTPAMNRLIIELLIQRFEQQQDFTQKPKNDKII